MARANTGRHDYFLTELFNKPSYLGIDAKKIIAKAKEQQLYLGGRLIAEPDLIFTLYDSLFYFEVKSSPSLACRQKGRTQMQTMYDWVRRFGDPHKTKIGLVYPRSTKSTNLERLILEWHC
jgi:hypothetical protein